MSADSFNLRHLRYFLAVADAGSFRAASAKLNVAQSAVSRRIADLEAIFGVRLFERQARGIALSDAGNALRRGALRIGAELDDARAALTSHRDGPPSLRIGLYGTTSQLAFVPRLIERFRAKQPRIALDLAPQPHGDIDAASLAALDLAFHENAHVLPAMLGTCLLGGVYLAALPRGDALGRHDSVALRRCAMPR